MQDRPYLGYLRVSKEDQAKHGVSLDAQRAAIMAEARKRDWSEVRFIEDAGLSAKNTKRPGLIEARALLARGEAAGLVVSMMDRLSRSLLDFITIMAEAEREGWTVLALDCPWDTTTPSGEAMIATRAVFAQWERRMIGQRIKDSLAIKREQGVRLGRPRSVPDPVVERIVGERMGGATLTAIAAGLNDDGVPTAHGGARWYPSTVRYVCEAAA